MTDVGDKLLWTAVIAGAIAAYFYVPSFLHHVRELAVVSETPEEKPNPQLSQDAEDAITPSTIQELANGYSYNLGAAAIRLAVSRFVKSGERAGLLSDLSSKAWYRRDRAINVFLMLLKNQALQETDIIQHFIDSETFSAIVTALSNLLPQHSQPKLKASAESEIPDIPPSPIRPYNRPAHERSLLSIINRLLHEPKKVAGAGQYYIGAQIAIEAGIITKWLANYPFPCALPENSRLNFKKSDVCSLMDWKTWGNDDILMAQTFNLLMKQPLGLRQLAEAGLRTTSFTGKVNIQSDDQTSWGLRRTRSHSARARYTDIDDDNDIRMVNGEGTAGQFIWHPYEPQNTNTSEAAVPRPGSTDRSPEEELLRRRHREAVVVAEAGAPLQPENILQRMPTETEINWERAIADQQEAILRRRASASNVQSTSRLNPISDQQAALERIDGLSPDHARVRGPSFSGLAGAEFLARTGGDTTLPSNYTFD